MCIRDRCAIAIKIVAVYARSMGVIAGKLPAPPKCGGAGGGLLYTSSAADGRSCGDLGGGRIV